MTQIDFYILTSSSLDERLRFTCRVIEKAFKQGRRIHIATDNEQQAEQLQHWLWSYKPQSFLAHDCHGQVQRHANIHIGFDGHCGDHHDLLINLCGQTPEYFSRFERLIEVVSQEENILKQTREHYSFYKKRGYPINNHKISA